MHSMEALRETRPSSKVRHWLARYTLVGQPVRKGRHLGENRDDSHARQPAQ